MCLIHQLTTDIKIFQDMSNLAKIFCHISILEQTNKVLWTYQVGQKYHSCGSITEVDQSADLLTFVSDRIASAFNKSGTTRAVALDISKTFDRVWHAGLLHKLKNYGISGQIFSLISSR